MRMSRGMGQSMQQGQQWKRGSVRPFKCKCAAGQAGGAALLRVRHLTGR